VSVGPPQEVVPLQAQEYCPPHLGRPFSNLRIAKNIEHQLSRLHDSALKNESIEDSNKKQPPPKHPSALNKWLEEGRQHMNNNNFAKANKIFQEYLKKESEHIEAQYLLGLSHFYLENYAESVQWLSRVLDKDDHFRNCAYLFLAISHKKTNNIESAISVVPAP
jgi:tetratricopeptide (TPR) repeat protein